MRRNESPSSDEDGPTSPESDSEDVDGQLADRNRRHMYPHHYAKRMSLLASYKRPVGDEETDIMGTHPRTARRFFHSAAVWDPTLKTVVARDGGVGAATRSGAGIVNDLDLTGPGVNGHQMQLDTRVQEDEMVIDGDDGWRDADVSISVES